MGLLRNRLTNTRTNNYLKQVKRSLVFKIGTIGASFIAVPLMISYLGEEKFGIWATMLTIFNWIMLFDFGVANGLKNKVSESLVKENYTEASSYISTAYGLIGLFSLFFYILFLLISAYIPWNQFYNTKNISYTELRSASLILAFFIFFNFWLSLINQIYHGLQKSSFIIFGQFVSNFFALIFIVVLKNYTKSSILLLTWAYGFSMITSNILLSVFIFRTLNRLAPKIKYFDKTKIKPLLGIGVKFFVIQIAVVVIFLTDKILITQLLGPSSVTPYEVLFKLFSTITISHSLLLTPLWPAFSDAFYKQDFRWIQINLWQQIKIVVLLIFISFLLALFGPSIVDLWVGNQVKASGELYFLFAFFVSVSVWNNVFACFVNSTNKINIQFYTSIFGAILNVPLSIFFVNTLGMGLSGIILSTIVSLSFFAFLGPIQVYNTLYRVKLNACEKFSFHSDTRL